MANYPTSLPSTTPTLHSAVNDEIVAIATTLGLSPQGGSGTVKTALQGRKTLTAYDEFSRYSNGAIEGGVPLVGTAWHTTGAQIPTISGGKCVSTGIGYIFQPMTASVYGGGLFCETTFTGDIAGTTMTLAWSLAVDDLSNIAIHMNFGPSNFLFGIRHNDVWDLNVLEGAWRKQITPDGTTVGRVSVHVRGETVVIIGPNGESFALTDPRIATLRGTGVFWEPTAVTSPAVAASQLVSCGAYTYSGTGTYSLSDMGFDFAGAGGERVGKSGEAVGNRDMQSETMTGYHPTLGSYPCVTFGPVNIITATKTAISAGGTSLVTEHPITSGSSAIIKSGVNRETVTTNTTPSGTGPYTHGLTAGTVNSHPVNVPVVATVPTSRATMWFNPSNDFFYLPNKAVLVAEAGNLYLGSALDTYITRLAANVIGPGNSGGLRAGIYTTAGRPTAASMGQGTMIYDSTLAKPIWSTGSVWKDAAGTTV